MFEIYQSKFVIKSTAFKNNKKQQQQHTLDFATSTSSSSTCGTKRATAFANKVLCESKHIKG